MPVDSAKQQTSISRIMNLLQEWDRGTKVTRKKILTDFIKQNMNKTGPELDQEFAQAASLFLTRLTAWLRLTYMLGTCLNEQLQAISIFLSSSSGHKFLVEFLEVGGILTLLEIIGLKQAKESSKSEALRCLHHIGNAGRKYKELICESYGIRSIAECMAKSGSEETQDACRNMLLMLANGNPRFLQQVYKGLIALMPCTSPKAQQMATNALRTVQPIVASTNASLIEPLLALLRSLHLEVQYEAMEFIRELMQYDIADTILSGLVTVLRPSREELMLAANNTELLSKMNAPLPVFVQQASASKVIGMLAKDSNDIAEKLIQMRVVHHLMYAMGNSDHADSQRQASITLEYFCCMFAVVNDHVREAMGDVLYDMFMGQPESLYANMNHIQADVLTSNKVNIPGNDTECM